MNRYPSVEVGKRYLNSGLFIGYAAELYELVRNATLFIENDQEYYTEAYVNEDIRCSLRIGLDHRCEIFQTFENARNNLHLVYNGNGNTVNKNVFYAFNSLFCKESEVLIHNQDYDTYPLIFHGPGFWKPLVSSLRNFLPRIWTPHEGCISCNENIKDLSKVLDSFFVNSIANKLKTSIICRWIFFPLFLLLYSSNRLNN